MEDQVPQPVDRSKLVDVATRHPQHLVDAVFLGPVEGLLQGLFELSGSQKFDVHAMQPAHVISGPFIKIHSVAILVF